MVMAVDGLDLRRHRPAHHQPHHQFHPFGTRFAQVIDMGYGCGGGGIVDQQIKETIVEVGVNQPGPFALQLVRHAAGAEDHHAQVFVERLHRAADGLAELQAAGAGGRRILHDVDRQRNDRAGPSLHLTEGQRQRHGQAVVDLHLIDDGDVEFIENERLRHAPRQLRRAQHWRHRAAAHAFVGDVEPGGAAQREGRDQLQRKGVGVVVVNHDGDVGLKVGDPLARRLVTGEHRLPVRLAGQALIHGDADGGNVGGGVGADDFSHYSPTPIWCDYRQWGGRRPASWRGSRRG